MFSVTTFAFEIDFVAASRFILYRRFKVKNWVNSLNSFKFYSCNCVKKPYYNAMVTNNDQRNIFDCEATQIINMSEALIDLTLPHLTSET